MFGPHLSAIEGLRAALAQHELSNSHLSILSLEEAESVASEGDAELDGSYGNYLNEILPRHALLRGRVLLRRALSLSPQPTGIVCYNAVMSIGALQEAQVLGVRVPQDVALASASRNLAAELSPLSLTTCDVPALAAATTTLNLLFQILDGESQGNKRVSLDPVLRVGNTTVPSGENG